ncbi:MAG: enoyl-CoA hydratase-related protein, partial [Halorientalis sp.]
ITGRKIDHPLRRGAEYGTKSPVALELAKQAIRQSSRTDLDAGIEYEAELFVQLFATRDKDEGIAAFLDGREPEFTGE